MYCSCMITWYFLYVWKVRGTTEKAVWVSRLIMFCEKSRDSSHLLPGQEDLTFIVMYGWNTPLNPKMAWPNYSMNKFLIRMSKPSPSAAYLKKLKFVLEVMFSPLYSITRLSILLIIKNSGRKSLETRSHFNILSFWLALLPAVSGWPKTCSGHGVFSVTWRARIKVI